MTDPDTVAKNVILKMGVRELSGIQRVSQRMAQQTLNSIEEENHMIVFPGGGVGSTETCERGH